MMLSEGSQETGPSPTTVFRYGDLPTVPFSSKAVVVTAETEDDLQGAVRIEDVPSLHQMPITNDSGDTVKRTIIFNEMVAYEMQQRPSISDGRQLYQVCGRTIENKGIFPFHQFSDCLRVAATYMAQNIIAYHGGQDLDKYCDIGFWSPRVKLLYARGLEAYLDACSHPQADPSMLTDEVFVTAQISVRPFSFSLTMRAFPFSSMNTCQVRICKGLRPESFLRDVQLSHDPSGLTRLITPPISDVILLHPETQRLSEGLLSNFFATRYVPQPAHSQAMRKLEASKRPSTSGDALGDSNNNNNNSSNNNNSLATERFQNYHLICAPLSTIHQGAMLDIIWRICKRDGIQVSFAAPNLSGAMAGKWSGAFIVNNAYQVLPIDTMYLTDRKSTKVEFGSCPLVSHLQSAVFEMFHDEAQRFI
ncbi:hypothetical protein GGI12_002507 [Dipsacomyces acuminosporus]|nr:hypothetical protein GGI12_002507 [Dipsacomyces acuminosporus]